MEKLELGEFVIVDFSEEAKRLGLPRPKTLYHFYCGKETDYKPVLIKEPETFIDPSVEIEELKAKGIFVHDKTLGQLVPPETVFIPKEARILGVLQTKRYLKGFEIMGKE